MYLGYSFFSFSGPSDVKDYIVLQILPMLCKQKGRVKLGNKNVKPSVEESKESFILFVPVSNVLTLLSSQLILILCLQSYFLVLGCWRVRQLFERETEALPEIVSHG